MIEKFEIVSGKKENPSTTIKVWLQTDDEGGLDLMTDEGIVGRNIYLLTITKEGYLQRHGCVSQGDTSPFEVNDCGEIALEDEDD